MDEKKWFIKESTLTGMGDAMREALGTTNKIPIDDFESIIRVLGSSTSTPDPHVLMPEQTVSFVSVPGTSVWLWNCSDGSVRFELIEGEVYTVVWNKQEYACTAKAAQFSGTNGIGIGNFGAVDLGDNTGEPFLLGVADDGSIACYAFDEPIDGNCTIGVYDIGLAGGTAGGSGAMPDDVHTVTFMDETGENVLYTRSVADGDDCADPVERLLMDEPTKDSTVQYVYDHNGWATSAGGSADSSVLDAVTEDKVVYAVFSSSLRYYTISYYDDDGVTLLHSESLAYGSTPSYTPTSDTMDFVAWVPTVSAVTGNASYTATWKEKASFATATWEEISAITTAGTSSESFKVGDTKRITMTYSGGTTEEVEFAVAEIMPNGRMVLITTHALETLRPISSTLSGSKDNSVIMNTPLGSTIRGTIYSALPEDFRNIMQSVSTSGGKAVYIKPPTDYNVWANGQNTNTDLMYRSLSLLQTQNNRIRKQGLDGSAVEYWVDKGVKNGSYYYFARVDTTGAYKTGSSGANGITDSKGIVFIALV